MPPDENGAPRSGTRHPGLPSLRSRPRAGPASRGQGCGVLLVAGALPGWTWPGPVVSSHQFPTWQRGGERGSLAYSALCRKPDSPCAASGLLTCTLHTRGRMHNTDGTDRPTTWVGDSSRPERSILRRSGDTFAEQTPSGPKPEFDFPQQPELCPPRRPGNPAPGREGPAALLGVKGRERKSRGKPCSTLFSIYV